MHPYRQTTLHDEGDKTVHMNRHFSIEALGLPTAPLSHLPPPHYFLQALAALLPGAGEADLAEGQIQRMPLAQ